MPSFSIYRSKKLLCENCLHEHPEHYSGRACRECEVCGCIDFDEITGYTLQEMQLETMRSWQGLI